MLNNLLECAMNTSHVYTSCTMHAAESKFTFVSNSYRYSMNTYMHLLCSSESAVALSK